MPSDIHVAVIMDGNGRWAKKRGLPRFMGHREGVKTVKRIVTHAVKREIKALSAYAFSAENWLRPKEEVSFLMKLLDEYMATEWDSIMENNIQFLLSGRLELVPEYTRNKLLKLREDSKNNTGMKLNLAISYSSKDELTDCMKSIAEDVKSGKLLVEEITSEVIRSNLYNPSLPDIDLLIRTSGEKRISNFMLWQSAYAEFYFTDVLWPDFTEDEFDKALAEYGNRVRRFGMTDEQIKEKNK